jgi:hypothetical protein
MKDFREVGDVRNLDGVMKKRNCVVIEKKGSFDR